MGASGFLGSRLLAAAPRDVDLAGTGGRRPVRPGNWRELHVDLGVPVAARRVIEDERPGAVFFSSDLVFDGRAGGYTEESVTAPVVPYGAMKAQAEALVRAEHPGALIIRTSLLVGESGIMLRPAFECETLVRGQPVDLYRDEWRSPTHVDDVARAAWEMCMLDVAGVYHVAGPERLSRVELGRIVCALYHFDPGLIREGDRPPDRPRDTSLVSHRAARLLGWAPRALSTLARQPEAVRA